MSKKIFLSFCVLLNILLSNGQTYTSVINTASGPVRGFISTTIENVTFAGFKGIPYAKPPIGNLRFKPPLKADSWVDIYNAITEGSMCTQFDTSRRSAVGSEDCLYVNVFTPHTVFNSSISKPVMVWIYGGSFKTGNSYQSYYGPDFILGQDVIMVSFNYRLDALGFLNLEHDNVTGNCGLKDQNLALKWIKRNIANFGGNPNKITIFGQSAGSASVDLQVASDMSVGLFSQSISMSGATLNLYWGIESRAEALENGFKLGSILGTNTSDKDVLLKTLYNASAADIVTAAATLGLTPFRPTVENPNIATDEEKFLTECSVSKYLSGNYTKGPHIMGFTANESVFFAGVLNALFKLTLVSLETFKDATGPTPYLCDLITEISIDATSNVTANNIIHFIKNTTDLLYVLGIDAKQRLISQNNNHPVYYYRFSFESNHSLHKTLGINLPGVGHADDLPYILYMPIAQLPLDQPDIATTRQRLVKLYTNFAKYGNPTPNGEDDEVLGITWPDSRLNGEHLEIGVKLSTGPRPIDDAVKNLLAAGLGASPVLNECKNNQNLSLRNNRFN